MKDRLIELVDKAKEEYANDVTDRAETDYIVECLLNEGVIVPPCKVGDTVYYVSDSPICLSVQANTIYEADVSRIITTRYGTTLVIQIHNSYGCTEIPDVNDFGKTVFLTREEAEKALQGVSNGKKN